MNDAAGQSIKADSTQITNAKQRYSAGVLKYREMGYWQPDYGHC